MNKFVLCLGTSALMLASAPVIAQSNTSAASVAVSAGKALYDSEGHRVGNIYRVTPEGDPQVILDGKLVTVPASTVSDVNGKLTTSISRADVGRKG